jgi:hypothetical protein
VTRSRASQAVAQADLRQPPADAVTARGRLAGVQEAERGSRAPTRGLVSLAARVATDLGATVDLACLRDRRPPRAELALETVLTPAQRKALLRDLDE